MTANSAPDTSELALLYAEGDEAFNALDAMQQEFVCIVVRAVREQGQGKRGPVELKTDSASYYAYPHPAGCIAWGINAGEMRFCSVRGLWAPDKGIFPQGDVVLDMSKFEQAGE